MVKKGRKSNVGKWVSGEGLVRLQGWLRDGLSNKQVAKNIGITEMTFHNWRKANPDFDNIIKKTKEVVDFEVENALLKRALGYEVDEVQIRKRGDLPPEKIVVRKKIPPDVNAQMFWLKNRKPEIWRERKDVSMTADIKAVNPFANLSEEELKKLVAVDDG